MERRARDDGGEVLRVLRSLVAKKLTSGASGNVSVRTGEGMLITPTGVLPEELQPQQLVEMGLDGGVPGDQFRPSSEWQMHADVYQQKPEVGAIVHCHSPYATILACAGKSIPPLHYMIAAVGTEGIPLAEYARFGTSELSKASLHALENARACLLANHGQLATGHDLESALALSELVEEHAHWYWGTLAIGGPKLLDQRQMKAVEVAFSDYGQQSLKGPRS